MTKRPVPNTAAYLLAALAVLVVGGVVAALAVHARHTHARVAGTPAPLTVTAHDSAVIVTLEPDGTQLLGRPDVRRTIDLFEDPICPFCGQFEQSDGARLAHAVDTGQIAIRYHLLNFLDGSSPDRYSTRADAAYRCVARTGDGPAYSRFHATLFTVDQPKEDGLVLSNAQLAEIARQSGASAAANCIAAGTEFSAAAQAADTGRTALVAALHDKAATPTVLVDGKPADLDTDAWLTALLE
jgi:protein-disulfide isomerase